MSTVIDDELDLTFMGGTAALERGKTFPRRVDVSASPKKVYEFRCRLIGIMLSLIRIKWNLEKRLLLDSIGDSRLSLFYKTELH